jgi:hypothetical protein
MVSSQLRSENVSVSSKYFRTEALNEWIRNVRSKKIYKKRQSRGQDLRAVAILTHTLLENQKILRLKQKERSERWTEMRKMMENNNISCKDSDKSDTSDSYSLEKMEQDQQKKNELKAKWKEELNDLDNFINNIDSIKTTLVR